VRVRHLRGNRANFGVLSRARLVRPIGGDDEIRAGAERRTATTMSRLGNTVFNTRLRRADAPILPQCANPAGWDFRERQRGLVTPCHRRQGKTVLKAVRDQATQQDPSNTRH